ncbi:MAG: RNA polymerase sigma factor [Chitinophagaceae bacterium]
MKYNLEKEKELIRQFVENHHKATETIYKNSFNMIKMMILQRGGNNNDAEDIFQEALIVLYHQAQKKHFELTSSISTYLYSVSKKLWLKKLNNNLSLSFVEDANIFEKYSSEIIHENDDEQELLLKRMEKAMEQLGEPCKSLLYNFYIKDWSMERIVQELGYHNRDSAKTQKYKCLMRLKKKFLNDEKSNK